MPGPAPKDPKLRQRVNRHSTAATLPSVEASAGRSVPDLPERDSRAEVWHPHAVEWWRAVWTSPMASEYLESDKRELYLLAEMHHQFWKESEIKTRLALAAEIRQRSVQFGLTPIDRRRLQWEIEKGDQAADRTSRRRQSRELTESSKKNPREVLKVVP